MENRKRRPENDINHENWDQEEEDEEVGQFKQASLDEIKRRVIRKPVRRFKSSAEKHDVPFGGKLGGVGGLAPLPKNKLNPFSFLSKPSIETPKIDANPPLTGIVSTEDQPVPCSPFTLYQPSTSSWSFLPADPVPFNPSTNIIPDPCCQTSTPIGADPVPFKPSTNIIPDPCSQTSTPIGADPVPFNPSTNITPDTCSQTSTPIGDNGTCMPSGDQNQSDPSTSQLSVKLEELNKNFITHIQSEVSKKPTSILSKCFKDYISQIEELYGTGNSSLEVVQPAVQAVPPPRPEILRIVLPPPPPPRVVLFTAPSGDNSSHPISDCLETHGVVVQGDSVMPIPEVEGTD